MHKSENPKLIDSENMAATVDEDEEEEKEEEK